jgi:Fe-S-cluster containining protein
MEALYIANKTGHKIINPDPKKINENIKTPCVFLKNGECSIYEYRPMVCRSFFSLDSPDYCADESGPFHYILRLDAPESGGFEFINSAYWLVMGAYKESVETPVIKGIRDYFGESQNESGPIFNAP